MALFRNLFLTRGALSAKNKAQLIKHLEQHSQIPVEKKQKVTIQRIKVLKIAVTCMTMLRYEFMQSELVEPLGDLKAAIQSIVANFIGMQKTYKLPLLDKLLGPTIFWFNIATIGDWQNFDVVGDRADEASRFWLCREILNHFEPDEINF